VKTTTKEYQDKQTQKVLKKRDSNVKKNKKDHRKFLQDAYNDAYKMTKKIMK
jgi:hypothetical protein